MKTSSHTRTLIIVAVTLLVGIPLLGVIAMSTRKKAGVMNAGMMGSSPGIRQYSDNSDSVATMEYRPDEVATTIAPMPPEYPQPGSFTSTEDRLFIKNAWLSLEVKSPQDSSKTVTQLAQNRGGVVTNLQMDTYRQNQGIVTATMTVRVPVSSLDAFIDETKKLAITVLSEQLSVDDATERAVDIDAQLKNLRATETQLLTIMAQAKTVEDTLRVQQELTSTRDRIERLHAQRDSLSGAAAMSTVQLTLTTDAGELPMIDSRDPSIKEELKNTIRGAIQLYRALFITGLKAVILISPLLLAAALAWFFLKKKPIIAKK